jgi:HK97 family phage portal protein
LFYRVDAANIPKVVHHTDMIHWKGLCYDNLIEGISPIEYHAQTLGISLSAERGTARNNKTNAKKILIKGETGKTLTDSQKLSLKQDLDDVYNGDSMALALPNGLSLDYLTMTPQEAEFLQQREYGAVEIARILNIPSSLLDADNGGNKSSVEQESLNFYTLTLHPKTTDFVQELNYKLLSNPNEYYKFNFNSLMRADANTRADYYIKGKKFGMSDNEIRTLEDMNGYEGGDRRYADLNQIPKDLEDKYYEAKIENMLKTNNNNNPEGNNNNTES